MRKIIKNECHPPAGTFTDSSPGRIFSCNLDNMHKRLKKIIRNRLLTRLVNKKLSTIEMRYFRGYLIYTRSYTHYPQKKG